MCSTHEQNWRALRHEGKKRFHEVRIAMSPSNFMDGLPSQHLAQPFQRDYFHPKCFLKHLSYVVPHFIPNIPKFNYEPNASLTNTWSGTHTKPTQTSLSPVEKSRQQSSEFILHTYLFNLHLHKEWSVLTEEIQNTKISKASSCTLSVEPQCQRNSFQ